MEPMKISRQLKSSPEQQSFVQRQQRYEEAILLYNNDEPTIYVLRP